MCVYRRSQHSGRSSSPSKLHSLLQKYSFLVTVHFLKHTHIYIALCPPPYPALLHTSLYHFSLFLCRCNAARKRDASPSVNSSPNLEDKRAVPAGPKFGESFVALHAGLRKLCLVCYLPLSPPNSCHPRLHCGKAGPKTRQWCAQLLLSSKVLTLTWKCNKAYRLDTRHGHVVIYWWVVKVEAKLVDWGVLLWQNCVSFFQ